MDNWDEEGRGLFDEDEEDNEDTYGEVSGGKEFVIYLVDCSTDMFLAAGDEGSESHFRAVMDCIEEDLKKRIISSESDQVGLCFFNTKYKKNMHDYDSVFVYFELGPPSAQLIRDVGRLKKDFFSIGSGPGLTPDSRDNPLFFALSSVQALLVRSGSASNVVKRVLLFTDNDDPLGAVGGVTKSDMRRQTLAKAQDMQDYGITLELFPLSRTGETFNPTLFYSDMIQIEEDGDNTDFMEAANARFDLLKQSMKKKLMKKRTVRRLMLTVCEGAEIGLKSYAMLRLAEKGKTVKVDARTNTLLKSETTYICADTGGTLAEPKKSVKFNEELVVFTRKELKEAKKLPAKPLQLLGFKPLECLRDYYNLRPATFLYPDEQAVKGSTCAFIALHQAMLEQKRFGVALYSAYSVPHLVALVAQEEVMEDGAQVEPPGINMIYLPWADDIRRAEKFNPYVPPPAPRATQEEIDLASRLVSKVFLKEAITPANPELQTHFAVLQALALEEEDIPEVVDETLPDVENMLKPSVAEAAEAFKVAVYGEGNEGESDAVAAKAAKASATAKRKEVSSSTAKDESSKYNWHELADTGKLKSLTVVELKWYLEANHLPQSGKKDLLIQRILTHLGK